MTYNIYSIKKRNGQLPMNSLPSLPNLRLLCSTQAWSAGSEYLLNVVDQGVPDLENRDATQIGLGGQGNWKNSRRRARLEDSNSDVIIFFFLQYLVRRLMRVFFTHHHEHIISKCEYTNEKVCRCQFWSRESECGAGLGVPYMVFLFHAGSSDVASCDACRSLTPFLSIAHRSNLYLRCLRITQDLGHSESTSPRFSPILPPSHPFSCSSRPQDLPLEFAR